MNGLWVILPLLFLIESCFAILNQFNFIGILSNYKKNDELIKQFENYIPKYHLHKIYYYLCLILIIVYIILVPSILGSAPFVPVKL